MYELNQTNYTLTKSEKIRKNVKILLIILQHSLYKWINLLIYYLYKLIDLTI